MANNIDDDSQKLFDDVQEFVNDVNRLIENTKHIHPNDVWQIRVKGDDLVKMAEDHWDDCIEVVNDVKCNDDDSEFKKRQRADILVKLWDRIDKFRTEPAVAISSFLDEIEQFTEQLMSLD